MYVCNSHAKTWKMIYARELYEKGMAVEQIALECDAKNDTTIRSWLRQTHASSIKHRAARLARKMVLKTKSE